MTGSTILRKLSGDVVGIERPLEIRFMARKATRVFELIIPGNVTRFTCRGAVFAGKRKRSRGMVERCRLPSIHRVTRETFLRKDSAHVVRIQCSTIALLVAIEAARRCAAKNFVDVAILTRCLKMFPQ